MDFYKKFLGKFGDNTKPNEVLEKFYNASLDLEKEILRLRDINSSSPALKTFIQGFLGIFEEGIQNTQTEKPNSREDEVWQLLRANVNSEAMNYLKNIPEWDKISKWVLLELRNKTLSETFKHIVHNKIIMHEYQEDCTLRKCRKEIKDRIDRIRELTYSIRNSEFLEQYEESKRHPVEPEKSEKQEENKEQVTLPVEEEKVETFQTMDELRGNLDRYKKLLAEADVELKLEQKQSFIREDYKTQLEKEQENKPFDVMRQFDVIRNILGPSKPDRTLRRSKTPKLPKLLRKASSFDDLDPKKMVSSHHNHENEHENLTSKLLNLFTFDKENKKMSVSTNRRSEHDNTISSIPEHSYKYGVDSSFDSHSTSSISGLTADDFRQFKKSEILFLQKYRAIQQECEYRDPPIRVIKLEDQGYKCFSCDAQLNKLLMTVWSSKFFCHYTGYWYCSECMSDEKHMIPWYVQDNFDFKKYHICKTARDELLNYYSKPNMLIDNKSNTVQKNKIFYDTLVMKRELHLMYDMICEGLYVLDLIGHNSNLLLKVNLLSLKQIVEIKEGAMMKFIERTHALLTKHIESCNICQSKGKICSRCHDKKLIFPYDIRNTSICRNCKTLYHTHCLKRRSCIVCNHNS